MLTTKDLNLFESVGRSHPQFSEYLKGELDKQIQILIKNPDGSQLSRAQGAAQTLQSLIDELNRFKNPR
jgi:hypothetical protein